MVQGDVSPHVVILTVQELRTREEQAFERGVARGRFEEGMEREHDLTRRAPAPEAPTRFTSALAESARGETERAAGMALANEAPSAAEDLAERERAAYQRGVIEAARGQVLLLEASAKAARAELEDYERRQKNREGFACGGGGGGVRGARRR